MLGVTWITAMAFLNLTPLPVGEPPQASPSPAATGFLYKTVEVDGQKYAYCVYVPPEYTPDKPWPVVLFLHGSGERGMDGFRQTDVGIAHSIRRARNRVPAIVVMPQCRPDMYWTGPMLTMAVRCLEAASREYHCDPERVYLTGLSMGGQGTWLLGAEYSAQFAALVPICGFAELSESSGAAARLAARLTDVPIWCFHGAMDPHVPVAKSREMVAAIREAGGNVRYTEYPDGKHDIWDRAYNDPELWQWLFAQRRSAAAGTPDAGVDPDQARLRP